MTKNIFGKITSHHVIDLPDDAYHIEQYAHQQYSTYLRALQIVSGTPRSSAILRASTKK
jgi:hypothetical protein